MRGITIIKDNERIHTGKDLDLVQEVKEIGAPEVQSYLIEVPGRNGLVNLTKGLTGEVNYKNRSLKFQYLGTGSREDLLEIVDLFNRYHGETIKIIDDDTPDYYYEGEVTVDISWNNTLLTIVLEVNANPFRENLELTTISTALSSDVKDIVITNHGVNVSPTIDVSSTAKITTGNNTYDLSVGKYIINDLKLKTGSNVLSVSGSGILTIEYREARI